MALSVKWGFSQVSMKQRTLQFLISRWKLIQAPRSSSLLSSAGTWESRKLGRDGTLRFRISTGQVVESMREVFEEWYSTWEPEEHILDQRLVQAYEEKEQRDRAVGHRRKGSKAKRLLLHNAVYTMDLRSAHKTPEKPPPRLRLSLTRSLGPEDEDPPYSACRQDPQPKSEDGRSQFKCLDSNPPSPSQEDWEDRGEEEEEEDDDDVDVEEDGEEEEEEEALKETMEKSGCILSGQERTDEWSSFPGPGDVWRPIIGPGEVTVTDVTLNSLTVTFRESRVAKGFFRDWGLEV